MSRFGATFRQLRQEQNRTQTEIARALGIARSTVSMYEQGEREPDLDTLKKIADYFHVDMNVILGYESLSDHMGQTCVDFEGLASLLEQNRSSLSTEQKQELMKILLS